MTTLDSRDNEAVRAVADRRQSAVGVESGAARAAVLGINDGLVTNISLILGVVGATSASGVVQLAGLASLVAGACSMAVGEYVSMRAQEELLTRLLDDERKAMQANPERERAVLRATLERQGFEGRQRRGPRGAELVRVHPQHRAGIEAKRLLGIPGQLLRRHVGSSGLVAFAGYQERIDRATLLFREAT